MAPTGCQWVPPTWSTPPSVSALAPLMGSLFKETWSVTSQSLMLDTISSSNTLVLDHMLEFYLLLITPTDLVLYLPLPSLAGCCGHFPETTLALGLSSCLSFILLFWKFSTRSQGLVESLSFLKTLGSPWKYGTVFVMLRIKLRLQNCAYNWLHINMHWFQSHEESVCVPVNKDWKEVN